MVSSHANECVAGFIAPAGARLTQPRCDCLWWRWAAASALYLLFRLGAAFDARVAERVEYTHTRQVRRGDGLHVERRMGVHIVAQFRPVGGVCAVHGNR